MRGDEPTECFNQHGVAYKRPTTRGRGTDGYHVIAFRDPDGMMLQLGGRPSAEGRPAPGKAPGIGHEHTIRGLHCATLWVGGGGGREPIERVLAETFGFRTMHDDESTIRFDVSDSGAGAVNVRAVGGPVRGALATRRVHDADDATQLPTRTHITAPGLRSTPVIDGMSFHSVEFRGPGGVLYEPPAEPPVGAIDEPVD